MQTILTESDSRTGRRACRQPMPNPSSATPTPAADEAIEELPTSRGFAALQASYRASSGTARGDDFARLLEDHGLGNLMGLARLIATSEVFGPAVCSFRAASVTPSRRTPSMLGISSCVITRSFP